MPNTSTMERNVISTLDRTGDSKVEWDPNVPDEVEVARAAFDAAAAKKYLIYKCDEDGNQGERIHAFDADARKIVCVPQTQGG